MLWTVLISAFVWRLVSAVWILLCRGMLLRCFFTRLLAPPVPYYLSEPAPPPKNTYANFWFFQTWRELTPVVETSPCCQSNPFVSTILTSGRFARILNPCNNIIAWMRLFWCPLLVLFPWNEKRAFFRLFSFLPVFSWGHICSERDAQRCKLVTTSASLPFLSCQLRPYFVWVVCELSAKNRESSVSCLSPP